MGAGHHRSGPGTTANTIVKEKPPKTQVSTEGARAKFQSSRIDVDPKVKPGERHSATRAWITPRVILCTIFEQKTEMF